MIDLTDLIIDIEHQRYGDGSCGGQAFSTHYEAIRMKLLGDRTEMSALAAWQFAKAIQGIPAERNEGVFLGAIFKGAKQYGIPFERDFPYTEANTKLFPSAAVQNLAKKNRIAKWEITYSFDDALKMLDRGFPVICLLDMGGVDHFVNLIANDGSRVKIVNSWGVEWLEQGFHWYSHDELRKMLKSAGMITKFPLTVVLAAKFNNLMRSLKWKG